MSAGASGVYLVRTSDQASRTSAPDSIRPSDRDSIAKKETIVNIIGCYFGVELKYF
jgi:hypothetical protein